MHFDKKYSQTDLPDPDPHFIICTNHNTDRSVLQQFQNPGKMGRVYRKMVHFTVPESGYYERTLHNPDHRIAFCTDGNLDRNRSLSWDSGNETEDAHFYDGRN